MGAALLGHSAGNGSDQVRARGERKGAAELRVLGARAVSVGGERGQRLWFDRKGTTFDTNASDRARPRPFVAQLAARRRAGALVNRGGGARGDDTPGALEFR